METKKKTTIGATTGSADADSDSDASMHAPRNLTFAENVILTMKILGGAVLIIVALWGINQWTSGR